METGIKSSFIPSDARSPSSARLARRTGFADLLILLSIVLLVASATLAVGVFLYVEYLKQSAASKVKSLELAKESFEPNTIRAITRLSDRMEAADKILAGHVAPSLLMDILEQLTLQTVSFSDLEFGLGDGGYEISMSGVARSVNSIALQADYLSKSGSIVSPVFSDIERQEGGVGFSLEAQVDPLKLRYSAIVNGGASTLLPPTTAPATQDSVFEAPSGGQGTSTPTL